MIIPFSKVGCSSDNWMMLNDVYLDGKKNDLSAFGVDLTDFTSIKILVRDKQVSISIRDQEIYNGEYQKTMGELVGLRFKFLGLGEIQSFLIKDQYLKEVKLGS